MAIFNPQDYGADLLPEGVERLTKIIGDTSRGQMIIGALGNCERFPEMMNVSSQCSTQFLGFFLLAMLSLSMFPMLRKHLSHLPHIQEKLVRGLLVPLGIADVSFLSVQYSYCS